MLEPYLRRVSWPASLALWIVGCSTGGDGSEQALLAELESAKAACSSTADFESRACIQHCGRLVNTDDSDACVGGCTTDRAAASEACAEVNDVRVLACPPGSSCAFDADLCRSDAEDAFATCSVDCGEDPLDLRCRIACEQARASDEAACGFIAVRSQSGEVALPSLPDGEPADLTVLLDDTEIAVVEAADARAVEHRTRPVRLYLGQEGVEVTVTQLTHAFEFGFPVDFREFRETPEELEFYRSIASDHASLMVAETGLKWRALEPEPGAFQFELGDEELAWAETNGFKTKMHTLLWGNAPPFSTGSGTPGWLRERFPNTELSQAEREQLRGLIRTQAEAVVTRYRGRIDIYDVTNETLNLLTPWFADRLGQDIVGDLFTWVRAIDPGAQLVMNEWIVEVFTGLLTPTAAEVRDRVLELLAAGVPVDAVGQQAHFAPTVVFANGANLETADLTDRTRIDDYARALDTLAETGLPIHMTEVTFNTPAEPEQRAAQAEAIMRVWWGHESVEQIVFWSLWNRVAARSALQHGVFDDTTDGTPTRHGAAILSLMNDRWRTRTAQVTSEDGAIELRATLGSYVAQWEQGGEARHVRFDVTQGPGVSNVVVLPENGNAPAP